MLTGGPDSVLFISHTQISAGPAGADSGIGRSVDLLGPFLGESHAREESLPAVEAGGTDALPDPGVARPQFGAVRNQRVRAEAPRPRLDGVLCRYRIQ